MLPLPVLTAPANWRTVDPLSDVHLQADAARTSAAWRRQLLETDADAVLMLGDLFEVWVRDDARGGAFESSCVQTLCEAASRRTLGFMAGNRDFLLGEAICIDCGMRRLPDATVLTLGEQRVVLTHGDALCLDDQPYQQFRTQIVYYVAEQAYRLIQGFNLLFQATQAHYFHNDTETVAKLMLVFHASEGSHLGRPLHLASRP